MGYWDLGDCAVDMKKKKIYAVYPSKKTKTKKKYVAIAKVEKFY